MASNRRQKRPRISSGSDRLSDLPDSLIFHILSFLPIKTVVATSILSKRWELLWNSVASLEFSYWDMYGMCDDHKSELKRDFADIVNKVLLLRSAGHLDKFLLQWWMTSNRVAACVNIWVRHSIARNLRSLDLDLGFDWSEVTIPETLFTCKTLESLKLNGGFPLQVLNVVCLPKLQVLEVNILGQALNESIHKLVSGSPVLHSLTITKSTDIYDTALEIASPSLRDLNNSCNMAANVIPVPAYGKLIIDAPNLESLRLCGPAIDCSIKGSISSLNTVYCCVDACGDFLDCNSTLKLVKSFNLAKFMFLGGTVMREISHATIPLSTRFERLTKLDIRVQCCEWSSLNVLLECCIRLQFLSIMEFGSCGYTGHKQCWKNPENVPECLSSSLARVWFQTFKGLEDEMSIVRYLMKHGSVLESVNVSAHSSMSRNKFQMLQAIARLPRLSTACSVEFD